MDDSVIAKLEGRKRLRRSISEKHRIVELATQPGASLTRVAQQQGVNANQVHYWATPLSSRSTATEAKR
jgi:transposase-like protein